MSESGSADSQLISDELAQRILARAIEFDAALESHVSQARLREIASDAGISPDAFDMALRESTSPRRALIAERQEKGVTGFFGRLWNAFTWGGPSPLAQSSFVRFLPGWLTAMVVTPLLLAPRTFFELGPYQIGLLTIDAAASVLGHAIVMLLLRRWWPRPIEGRSFAAGALTPLGVFGLQIFVLGDKLPHSNAAIVFAGVGAATTLLLYLHSLAGSRGPVSELPSPITNA